MVKGILAAVIVAAWVAAFTYEVSVAMNLDHVWPGTLVTFVAALTLFMAFR